MKNIFRKAGVAIICAAMLCLSACSGGNTSSTQTTATTESTTAAEVTTENTTTTEAATEKAPESETPTEKTAVRVATLKGPTGMGMAKLMQDNDNGTTANDYKFTVSGAPDDVTAAIISGEIDIAAVPANLAAVLYAKTEGNVQVAAINTLGVIYMLENGNTINSIEDLRGKTIYATGQGSTPEYALRYILSKNNIDPDKDVTIEYKTEHAELATLMTSGDIVIGMLPEPNVTAVLNGNSDVRIALNLTDEWNKVADDGSALIMGCVVVNKSFADANKAAVDAFLSEYSSSVEYVNANNEEASAIIESYGIIPKAAVAKKALPNCNIVFIDGDDMQIQLNAFYNVLFTANPKSVGGSLPDDNFYYKK